MEREQREAAKRQMMELMQAGQPWQAAAAAAGIQASRSSASRWQQEVRTRGEAAPRTPATWEALTLWLSKAPAVGCLWRPARFRT